MVTDRQQDVQILVLKAWSTSYMVHRLCATTRIQAK